MSKTKKIEEQVEALLAAEARPLEYVEDDGAYYVTIQVGASTRWRKYTGGRWVLDTEAKTRKPTDRVYRHEPAIYERIGPLKGVTVNGLVGEHNRWCDMNAARIVGGDVAHQLLVLAIEQTTDELQDESFAEPALGKMIRSIVKETVKETVVSVMEELVAKK